MAMPVGAFSLGTEECQTLDLPGSVALSDIQIQKSLSHENTILSYFILSQS